MLSRTDRCGNSATSWKTIPTRRRSGGIAAPAPATRRPPISMVPASGDSSPAIRRSTVVLPQPDGPSTVSISPGRTSRSTSSTATTSPNARRRPRIRTARGRHWAAVTRPLLGPQQDRDRGDRQDEQERRRDRGSGVEPRRTPRPRSRSRASRNRSGASSSASGNSLTTVRNTRAPPATMAGRRYGTVSIAKARTGPSPSVRPASSMRGPTVPSELRRPPIACGVKRTA